MRENIWIIDDDQSIRWVLERALQQANLGVTSFSSADEAIEGLSKRVEPDVVITDIRMPGMTGFDFMQKFKQTKPNIPVIIMTAHSDLDSAVSSYEGGAFEYLPKPFDIDEAVELTKRACVARKESKQQTTDNTVNETPEIIGAAPSMQEVFRAIGRLSQSNINVLINGQSGTGKELVAKALHNHSPRSDNQFIALNMAAIPKDLLESELFGHEKGAFTGAQSQRKGRFEQANGGTLFLDEIGDMPADLQTRLLRVLANGEFYRVGGHSPVRVDVRIVAATHQNLEKLVEDGLFREDLFHRLNVIRIHIPALNERKEDIPLLMDHFLKQAAQELSENAKVLSDEAREWLIEQPWPGNVRQLENLSRWLTVMASSQQIQMSDLPAELLEQKNAPLESLAQHNNWQSALKDWAEQELKSGKTKILDTALPEFERILIEASLTKTQGRKHEAATLLGWGRNTLTRKLKELN